MFHQTEASVAPGNTIYEAIWLQSIVNGTMTKPFAFYHEKGKRKKEKKKHREKIQEEKQSTSRKEKEWRVSRKNTTWRRSRNRAWQIDTEGIEKRVGCVLGSFLCVRASGRFVDPRLQFLLRLLCQLNWLAKVVDAPETARPCCTILVFFLFRRLYR